MRAKLNLALFRQSPTLLLITAVFLLLLVNLLDRLTGPELSTSIFYLLPVGMVAWFINRRVGVVFAVASAVFWLLTDVTTNTTVSHPLIPVWNSLVRLGFFLIVVWALTSLHKTREKEKELTSFVVHDLRAPLGNMLTALEMLETETAENKSGNSAELVNISLTSGRRMLILVNSLLDLARLEGGKMPVNRERVEVAELLGRASNQVGFLADYKRISLVHDAGEAGLVVTADQALTERVLVNLLSNAVKFSPAGGHIYLSAKQEADNQILIGIRDVGPGIPLDMEKQVFSRFGQVGTQNVGTGLGLTFCKLAIEAQNGRIWLAPNDSTGTLIHFTLPAG